MKPFFRKIFGSEGKEYIEKTSSQPLPTKLELENLSDQEVDYVQNNIGLANEFMKELGLDKNNHPFHPVSLVHAIIAWFDSDLGSRCGIQVDVYSNELAAGWGKYLEEKMDMPWYVITDEFGTEIGLYHTSNNTTVFPFSSTAKAFNNEAFGLLSMITEKVNEVINDH